MKQIIFLFYLCVLSLTLFAQKKPTQASIKVNAYAYRYKPKQIFVDVSNPTASNITVYRAWTGQRLTFDKKDGFELPAKTSPDYTLSVGTGLLLDDNTPPTFVYKGIMLIEYSINGKKQYYIVKKYKIIDLPATPKGEYKPNRDGDPSRT